MDNPETKQPAPPASPPADSVRVGSSPLGEKEAERLVLPPQPPVLPIKGLVLYPQVVLPVAVHEPRDIKLVNDVILGNRLLAMVAVKDETVEHPGPEHLHTIGCAAGVLKMMKFPDETTRLIVQGISRVRIEQYDARDPYLTARVLRLESVVNDSIELRALARSVVEQFQRLVDLSAHMPDELKLMAMNIDDLSRLADVVSTALNLSVPQRQELLETLDVSQRLNKVNAYLTRELQTAELSSRITTQVKSEMDKDQRQFILRRQLKAIQEELGEGDAQSAEIADLAERVKNIALPKEAAQEVERELKRLRNMPPQASEYHVARTYIEWVLALPWNTATADKLDIARAERILNADHYDLERVKQRILEYLAVRKLKPDTRGPILCFAGPPGVGKTSLGRSIARALGRKFVRISLGGVRDEAEIRGHRRTYVGALPGRIIQGLRKAESNNPVFMLDEIDKLGADFRGDPSAALLEVLDPEQNNSFSDHYLDVPFDLSRVMFITTANVLDTIPPPLRDRMEVLELPGYTLEEKLSISRRYLIPRQIEAHGLRPADLRFPEAALRALITGYTREAGLRNLEREIATLCRKRAALVARGRRRAPPPLTPARLHTLLGPVKFEPEAAERHAAPGVATGLAWTPAGGDILFIEVTRFPGNGRLILTGQLGDVMKESAQAALSYIRSRAPRLGIRDLNLNKSDVHVHVPAGAIPKDGPSAGVTIALAMISLFSGRPVRPDVAMSGEVTLRGRVLPVGGIKEKVLAARRAGIRLIVLPHRNRKDLADVPLAARKGLRFRFAEVVDDILPAALVPRTPATRAKPKPRTRARKPESRV